MEPRFAERLEALDFYFLVAKHLDRMSEGLKEGLDPGGTPNSSKLIAYYMQVQHYENLVTTFLPEYYWKKKKEILPTIPNITWTWSNVIQNLRFFDKISLWLQLLQVTCTNEGVLKIKTPYKVSDELEVYKDGFKPNFGDLE